ncbi:MAG: SRPBCC family protein [Deltaproteobacteria bacterium]|nr:SRPBCC family protein [Kofleriaceae bacterium]
MIELSSATEIDAPAEAVWRTLTDFEHFSEWNPFIREAHGTTDVGGTVTVRVQPSFGGPRLPLHATILFRDDNHELRWKGSLLAPWLGAGEHTFTIEPIGAHRVRFVQREVFTGALPRLLAPILARETQRGFDAMNLALKARAESADRARSWMLLEPRSGPGVRVESVGSALPSRRLTTADLMASTRHRTRIDLERLTGIRERRVCGPGEDSRSLAIAAARDCLSRSRHAAEDLDVVISASITRYVDGTTHRMEPPLSLSIKEAIGAHRATSFDLANACAGMLTGVFLLDAMIRKGEIQRGMVVSGEAITGLGRNAARSIRSIFSLQLASLTLGDGGAAVIVERAPDGKPNVLLAGFTTLAEHSRLCVGLPAPHAPGARMFTRARKIHEVAMSDGPALIEEVLASRGLRLGDIDWLIPHQTSVRAIRSGERALAARTGDHPRHVVVTVDEYGNTASTTLFIALDKYLREGRLGAGDKVLLLSVASGLEVGVVVLAIDELQEAYGHAN